MSFHRIIVGIDGRSGGGDALALARQVGSAGAAITLVHAYASRPPFPGASAGALDHVLRDDAHQMLVDAAEDDGHLELMAVADALPGRALHREAQERAAELICIGSCHHRELGRVRIGDGARGTLHGARCTVAVAPQGFAYASRPLRAIGVAYNGTAESAAALEVAREIAGDHDASIRLQMVIESDEQLRAAEQVLEGVLGDLGEHAGGSAVAGDPAAALGAFSASVDALVAGSRGRGGLASVLLGSTTDGLARSSACPLFVVPAPARAGDR